MEFNNQKFMRLALEEAKQAFQNDEVPIGCVIVKDNQVITAVSNKMVKLNNPLAHAEIIAIETALKLLKVKYLNDCEIYVTLEPCPMCAAAISLTRVGKLYFGAEDKKSGGVINGTKFYTNSSCHHAPQVFSGILESQCSELLTAFFKEKRLRSSKE